MQRALTLVQAAKSTWTRADLLKQLALVLPAETRSMAPEAAVALLHELADEALAGSVEQVVCLEAPQWPPLPDYLRRPLDGRSVYTRPGTTRYATRVQLDMEEQLLRARAAGGRAAPDARTGRSAARCRRGDARGAAGARGRRSRARAVTRVGAAPGPGRGAVSRADVGADGRGHHRPGGKRQDAGPGAGCACVDGGGHGAGARHRDGAGRAQRARLRGRARCREQLGCSSGTCPAGGAPAVSATSGRARCW